ncbi:B-cell receptor CD22 [Cyprinodon tularosa]|uniref:B-cell receptor CD22 n=1 Tax=Cyprinodon tularosa TaxID=77115 RepID=UPI0018E20522|nr:B-cell receptor CD22 [Cyprinodon tularosa]
MSSSERTLTAKEGSCIEMKCNPGELFNTFDTAYWFWMKNANWSEKIKDFVGTVVSSTNESQRSVSAEFKYRVKHISSPKRGKLDLEQVYRILICDLRKSDSGLYQCRFVGDDKWKTDPWNLTVQENACPITFSQPPAVKENISVTLTCSTLISCDSDLQIDRLNQLPSEESLGSPTKSNNETTKSISRSLTPSWKDDGSEFSCQTQENMDEYLMRKINLTVEYPPKEVRAMKSPGSVKEGNRVSLTCSAKGTNVTFIWFKSNTKIKDGQLQFSSIKASDSGSYYCEAQNKHGTGKSNTININVLYPPVVVIQIEGVQRYHIEVKEGESITLVCNVNRANPKPESFKWIKDGKYVWYQKEYNLLQIKPEDSGVYQCEAQNTAGSTKSNPFNLEVQYKPKSRVSISATHNKVKVNSFLKMTCNTTANPKPWFSWYHYKQSDSSNWTPLGSKPFLTFNGIQRTDEGCYICNASNTIGQGKVSQPECIQVIFPPTNVKLSLVSKVREGQSVTINCSAESSPLSGFELKRSSAPDLPPSEMFSSQAAMGQNVFTLTFNATYAHAGFYTCIASNSEGTNSSYQRKLEVEYSPKNVKVEAKPGLEVKENEMFSLKCTAQSNPPGHLFKWITKSKDGKETTVSTNSIYTVKSSRPSDSGLYRCEVQNVIGRSETEVEIKIKYAPKQTTIIKGEEQHLQTGGRFVMLSCSSHCYPSAEYMWYNATDNRKLSHMQNLTVYSQQAGDYYCIAQNEMGQFKSDSVRLFDGTFRMIMKGLGWLILILLIIGLLFLYRHKMKKANQQSTRHAKPCCSSLLIPQGFCTWWRRAERGNARNENIFRDTSRSRDDLLPEQQGRRKAQPQEPRPDVTSTSHHVNTVYSTVNLPFENKAPSAQRPGKAQQKCMEDDSLNYASLPFKDKEKVGVEAIYSQVCKPIRKQEAQEHFLDYENINPFSPTRKPCFSDDDSETSDEEEVSYSQVTIAAKPSHQTETSDSSTSDSSTSDEETQYSDIIL